MPGADFLILVFIGHCGAVGQAHAQRFKGGGHCIGSKHTPAGAETWTGVLFNIDKLVLVNGASPKLSNRFKYTNNGQIVAVQVAGLDGAAINKESGNIQPSHGNHGSRHIFIATTYAKDCVHAGTPANGFDGVGDHFPAD